MSAIIPSIQCVPIMYIKHPFENMTLFPVRWNDYLALLPKDEAKLKDDQIRKLKDENDK